MTREEILEAYDVVNGIIRSPGKFEGEPIYAPHFHEYASDGEELSFFEDGAGEYASLIEIDEEDRMEFEPELTRLHSFVLITENDQGFVGCIPLHTDDAEQTRRAYEAVSDLEEDDC